MRMIRKIREAAGLLLHGRERIDRLAEELARRDMEYQPVSRENYEELVSSMDDYIAEFEANGTDNLVLSSEQ